MGGRGTWFGTPGGLAKSNKTHKPATNMRFAGAVQPVMSSLRMQWSSSRSCKIKEARQLMRNKFVVDI